jgi:hypothetical protein
LNSSPEKYDFYHAFHWLGNLGTVFEERSKTTIKIYWGFFGCFTNLSAKTF